MKKLRDLNKGFSNLELEGHGWGIIMGVTRLLLLGPFYTMQTKTENILTGSVCEGICSSQIFTTLLHYHELDDMTFPLNQE